MIDNRLLAGTLALVLISGIAGTQAFAQSTTDDQGDNDLVEPLAISPRELCDGDETDLLIQDFTSFWSDNTDDPRGAYVTELIAQDKNWCEIDSSEIGATDLSQFKVIIIAANQDDTFYGNIFPAGIVHPDLDTWVLNGGVMSASLGENSHGDRTFIGGLKAVHNLSNDLTIELPSHPLITGASPCPSGNCGVIADTGFQTDLDDFGFSSHDHFIDLPADTTIILTDDAGEPVAVEYPHGAGIVVANGLTDACMYSEQCGDPNKKFIANDIAYQNSIDTAPIVGGEFLPLDSTALLMAGMSANLSIIVPIAAGIAGVGAYYIRSRMNKD